MDYESGYRNAKHFKDSTTLMIFYPHAPPLPAPGEPAPPSQHPPQNPRDTPPSPLHVISPRPLPSTYLTSTILPCQDSALNDSELCTHHPNTAPTYCFDCDLTHSPGECDGVFGLSKRSGLWFWFVMKWIRLMVGVKSGRVAGEDSAFVQIAGVREVGYRWVGGREGIWGAVRMR